MASVTKPTFDAASLELAVTTLQQRIDLLQESLTQQQRLATLGMVTSVIAHEFNNILTPMISYARYAMSAKGDEVLRDKALAKALSGAERLAGISQSLLGFARGDESTSAQVAHAVSETLACLSREPAKDGITLTQELPEDVWVGMNGGQLQQVLMNLIVNARSAMLEQEGRGLKRMAIRAVRVKRNKIVEITIADTGPGIPAEVLPRIFEPFFSTKSGDRPADGTDVPRGGTGLGLTICQELVQAAGGTMRVDSVEGQGTTFTIELPAAEAKAA